jgi:RHS repeat-associated protein
MMIPGRQYSAGSGYRYGFNGKENDNEVKGEGNQQDYGMRIYDPRLGKFLSVDPLTNDYPTLTPYQFASNSPIAGIDLDGGEFKYYALDWKDKNQTRLKVSKLVRKDNDITLVFTFRSVTTFNIPISIDRSLVGLTGNFVNYQGKSVRIPDNYDINNLPSQDDPIWNTFQTEDEVDENFIAAVKEIAQRIQDGVALKSLVAAGGLPAFLKKNNVVEKAQQIAIARRKAVKDAWALEKELVIKTGRGTRDWTRKELAELKKTGKVKGYEGHHINNVAENPRLAGDASNIKFVKGRKEHLNEHDGNFQNPTSGELIDRRKMIEDNSKKSGVQ